MNFQRWSCVALLVGSMACSSTDDERGSGGNGDGDGADGNGDGDGQGDGNGDGDGAGDGDGDGDGNGNGEDGNDGVCEEVVVRAEPTTPDMLIVLDRSGSMEQEGRWQPSVDAVKSVTEQLDDVVRFGLMLFPDPGDTSGETEDCFALPPEEILECLLDSGGGLPGADLACAPGQLNVPVDLNAGPAIADKLNGMVALGGTPTGPTLESAKTVLSELANQPDRVPTPQFVLLVSDGQPTCPSGDGSTDNQQALDQTIAAVDALLAGGVKTSDIGYDTQNDAQLASVLDEFAQHGGTERHRAVENEASLVQEFRAIAGEVVACSFVLEQEPSDPSFVKVELDGTQLNLGEENGWSIEGKTITLGGAACETLQDGTDHRLSVEVLCEVVIPQ